MRVLFSIVAALVTCYVLGCALVYLVHRFPLGSLATAALIGLFLAAVAAHALHSASRTCPRCFHRVDRCRCRFGVQLKIPFDQAEGSAA